MRASRVLIVLGTVISVGCSINQRAYYRAAIEKFKGIPPNSERCWLAADLVGGGHGDNTIAEEEFTHYLVEKQLCRVIEKHPDATDGYTWPESDRCPCAAGQQVCTAQCSGGGGAGALPVPGIGGFLGGGGGGGGSAGDDNNRSGDKILERYKKASLPDKLITYRIDEMSTTKCVIHFRVSDVKKNNGTIEASEVIVVLPSGGE